MWIERSDDDYRAARIIIASENPPLAAICFNAHACVEELLKAIVVSQGTFPPRTHQLAALLAMGPPELRNDEDLIAACEVLQAVYPKSRYHPHPMPTPDEAQHAFEVARTARERLLKQLKPFG